MNERILIVDDERTFLNSVVRKLRLEGYASVTAETDPTLVPPLLEAEDFAVAFLDIAMPGASGLDLLRLIKERSPETECIMVTANQDIPSVVQSIKLGAYDYLVKPIQPNQMLHALDRALERRRMLDFLLLRQDQAAEGPLENPGAFEPFLTCNDKTLRILREAELHARSDIAVLVTGETGVGKELLALAIHLASPRASGPFVPVNMLSLTPSLFESEFFGHVRGAFTGATQDKAGCLTQARSGTLFLDEIGDLPMELQGKLLRILQEGEFTPVGGTRPQRADVRFIAATNQDLEALVRDGRFRKDLYYRLRFARLHLPPLRERKDDIRLLAHAFVKHSSRPEANLGEEAEAALVGHDWPGNVRELRGVIEAAANLAERGEITPALLNIPKPPSGRLAASSNAPRETVIEPLAEVERRHILTAYHALGDNKTQTARALGVSLATLQRKLKAYRVK